MRYVHDTIARAKKKSRQKTIPPQIYSILCKEDEKKEKFIFLPKVFFTKRIYLSIYLFVYEHFHPNPV